MKPAEIIQQKISRFQAMLDEQKNTTSPGNPFCASLLGQINGLKLALNIINKSAAAPQIPKEKYSIDDFGVIRLGYQELALVKFTHFDDFKALGYMIEFANEGLNI